MPLVMETAIYLRMSCLKAVACGILPDSALEENTITPCSALPPVHNIPPPKQQSGSFCSLVGFLLPSLFWWVLLHAIVCFRL